MSSMIYLSSDSLIPEILNPHERSFSINEALDMGMEVPEHLLTSGIDPNWKNLMMILPSSPSFRVTGMSTLQ